MRLAYALPRPCGITTSANSPVTRTTARVDTPTTPAACARLCAATVTFTQSLTAHRTARAHAPCVGHCVMRLLRESKKDF